MFNQNIFIAQLAWRVMKLWMRSAGRTLNNYQAEWSTVEVRDFHKDTVIGDRWAGTEIIYYSRDHYITDVSAYNRSFQCMEPTLMP